MFKSRRSRSPARQKSTWTLELENKTAVMDGRLLEKQALSFPRTESRIVHKYTCRYITTKCIHYAKFALCKTIRRNVKCFMDMPYSRPIANLAAAKP